MKIGELAERVRSGDSLSVARAISHIEKDEESREELMDLLFPFAHNAHMWGITGAPGSGKSTLVDSLISRERRLDKKVGVLAVDPSSPFSGGALLGDRIRMQHHTEDPGVFIRSMASRGQLGGVSSATADAAKILSAAGFDTVIIETIGVGQAEVEIIELVDIILLVLVPGTGDEVQIMKAGVMEIGDLFIVNKSDREGAQRLKAELEYVLRLDDRKKPPPVRLTSAKTGEGIDALHTAINERIEYMMRNGELEHRRERRLEIELRKIISKKIHELLDENLRIDSRIQQWVDELMQGASAPYGLIGAIIEEFKESIR